MRRKAENRVDVNSYSPLVLAYLGDAVFELVIRTRTVREGNRQVNRIHHETVHYVKAETQAKLARHLEPLLTKEERDVLRHGRNAHSHTMAKHAAMIDYRMATGFEALLGSLWLSDRRDRIAELVSEALDWLEREEGASASPAPPHASSAAFSEGSGTPGGRETINPAGRLWDSAGQKPVIPEERNSGR